MIDVIRTLGGPINASSQSSTASGASFLLFRQSLELEKRQCSGDFISRRLETAQTHANQTDASQDRASKLMPPGSTPERTAQTAIGAIKVAAHVVLTGRGFKALAIKTLDPTPSHTPRTSPRNAGHHALLPKRSASRALQVFSLPLHFLDSQSAGPDGMGPASVVSAPIGQPSPDSDRFDQGSLRALDARREDAAVFTHAGKK